MKNQKLLLGHTGTQGLGSLCSDIWREQVMLPKSNGLFKKSGKSRNISSGGLSSSYIAQKRPPTLLTLDVHSMMLFGSSMALQLREHV